MARSVEVLLKLLKGAYKLNYTKVLLVYYILWSTKRLMFDVKIVCLVFIVCFLFVRYVSVRVYVRESQTVQVAIVECRKYIEYKIVWHAEQANQRK